MTSQGPPYEPVYPSDQFSERFRHSYRYAFCIFVDAADNISTVEEDDTKWVALNLNPQQFSLREPYATVVTPTQGGGKIVESRGQIIKMATISGTTGYLPPAAGTVKFQTVPVGGTHRGRLVSSDPNLDRIQGKRSGFFQFHQLRYLFRRYGYERRLGHSDVRMYFLDFKDDDFWRIEPDEFALTRSSRKPFSYDYSISFKCLEVLPGKNDKIQDVDDLISARQDQLRTLPAWRDTTTNAIAAIQKLTRAQVNDPRQANALRRMGQMLDAGLAYVSKIAGTVQIGFQFVLKQLSSVLQLFQDAKDTARNVGQTPLVLMAQLDNAISGFFPALEAHASDDVKQQLNEWLVEISIESDLLQDHLRLNNVTTDTAVSDADKSFSTSRMRLGAVTDQLTEPADSTGTPDVDPLLGASGLDLVTDVQALSSQQLQPATIHHGEDIFALALRLMGSINRFVDLVFINHLEFPYVVSNQVSRPADTLAWGDTIMFPAPVATTPAFSDPGGHEILPVAAGTIDTSGLTTEVIDSTQEWLDNQWVGYTVTLSNGGTTESRVVTSNTEDTLTVETPWTITITPGATQYIVKLVTFSLRLPESAESRAYGRDIFVRFTGGLADVVIGSSKDLVTVSGTENLVQAIKLRANCPLGEHPIHAAYGLPQPVGRPGNANVAALALHNARMSLLADPRVAALTDTSLDLEGDKFFLNAKLRPVLARTALPIKVNLTG